MTSHLDTFTGQMGLIDALLRRDHDTDLRQYLTSRRAGGLSYDAIARELEDLLSTEGFSTTYGTIRRWCIRLGVEEVAS